MIALVPGLGRAHPLNRSAVCGTEYSLGNEIVLLIERKPMQLLVICDHLEQMACYA